MKTRSIVLAAIALALAALACSVPGLQQDEPTATPEPVETTEPDLPPEAPTEQPAPTAAPEPTSEPIATEEPIVEATEEPAEPALPVIGPENAAQVQMIAPFDLGVPVPDVIAWSPDGALLAAGSTAGVMLYDAHTLALLGSAPLPQAVTALVFSPDSRTLAAEMPYDLPLIQLFDASSRTLASNPTLDMLSAAMSGTRGAAFSPDSSFIAAGTDAGLIQTWALASAAPLFIVSAWDVLVSEGLDAGALAPYPVSQVFISPDGSSIAAGIGIGTAALVTWELPALASPAVFTPEGLIAAPVAAATLPPDWHRLTWISRASVIFVDRGTGLETGRLSHEDFITSWAFTPDSRIIAVATAQTIGGASQPVVKLWGVDTGADLATLTGFANPPRFMTFSPEGAVLAVRDNSGWSLWGILPMP